MLQLKALGHVGLKVRNLDRTLRCDRQIGLTVLRTRDPDSGGVRFAVLQAGSQELNIASHPDYVPQSRDNAAGIDPFCFEVDVASIDEVVAGLKRAGIEIADPPAQRRDGAAPIVLDPDGVKVELQIKGYR